MSTEATLAALADERLDELLDAAAWDAAIAEHGQEACDAALAAAQLRRDAIANQPRLELPAAVRERIMAQVAPAQPALAAGKAVDDQAEADHAAAAEVISPPASRWRAWIPALVAAMLAIAVLPTLLGPRQSAPSDIEDPGFAAQLTAKDDQDEQASLEPARSAAPAPATAAPAETEQDYTPRVRKQLASRVEPTAERIGKVSTAEDALSIDVETDSEIQVPEVVLLSDSSALADIDQGLATGAKPSASGAYSSTGSGDLDTVEGRRPSQNADHLVLAATTPGESAVTEPKSEYDDLLADARQWQNDQRTRQDTPLSEDTPSALPAAVAAESMVNELQRRGIDADAAGAVVQNSFAQTQPQILLITMGLIPGQNADEAPQLDVMVTNRGPGELTAQDGLLTLEGLDANNSIIWTSPLPAPAGAVIPESDRLRWRVPLSGDQLPPATVQALRLSAKGQSGDIMQLSPQEP